MVKKLIFSIIFFIVFFRITLFHPSFFLSVFPALAGSALLFSRKAIFAYFLRRNFQIFFIGFFIFLYALCIDLITGALLNNFSNSFSVRMLSVFVLAFLPAFFISSLYVKGHRRRLYEILVLAFSFQFFLWCATYINLDFKFFLYGLMGQGDSVNLLDHNIGSRGFGMSKDVNFTSPFMMVAISLYFLRPSFLSMATVLSQIINSNLAVVPLAVFFFKSNINFLTKVLVVLASFFMIYYFGAEYFPRFYAEFVESSGLRTIKSLLEDHVFLINNSMLNLWIGSGEYVFQGGHDVHSDIGWVIMMNYGGILFCFLWLMFVCFFSFLIFGKTWMAGVWVLFGVLLNTKGLMLSPNSYIFFSFMLMFLTSRDRFLFIVRKGCEKE